jgi:hypothetical protein
MYSSANEGEDKYNPTSPEDNEKRAEAKKLKEEEAKKKAKEIKHIKIKPSQGLGQGAGLETEPGLDDGNKRDDEREIGLQGGPAGSRGHLLDLATGAKTGTGSAMGTGNSAVRTGEPMEGAWSTLLKEDDYSYNDKQRAILEMVLNSTYNKAFVDDLRNAGINHIDQIYDAVKQPDGINILNALIQQHMPEAQPFSQNLEKPSLFDQDFQSINTSEPMEDAWSSLLKRETRGTIEGRRRREKRREFRPSTGQFKRPPGGQSPVGATMRRFRAHMRGIKGGKKTGLMKPHLAVEMSHRGIATKQPMSKDPQKYRQYMGQQEAKKILGNVRTTYSPHARHSARSFTAGPTGGGRLTGLLPGQSGQMRQPALQRLRRPRMPRMPRMRTPQMPSMPQMAPPMSSVPSMPAPSSSIMMSDERTESELLKSNRHARRTEMLALMRMLIEAQRAKAKASMKKAGTASAFEEGAVPAHPAGVQQHEDEDEKNDGPIQNLETNSSRLGLDPAGYLSDKRGHFG